MICKGRQLHKIDRKLRGYKHFNTSTIAMTFPDYPSFGLYIVQHIKSACISNGSIAAYSCPPACFLLTNYVLITIERWSKWFPRGSVPHLFVFLDHVEITTTVYKERLYFNLPQCNSSHRGNVCRLLRTRNPHKRGNCHCCHRMGTARLGWQRPQQSRKKE